MRRSFETIMFHCKKLDQEPKDEDSSKVGEVAYIKITIEELKVDFNLHQQIRLKLFDSVGELKDKVGESNLVLINFKCALPGTFLQNVKQYFSEIIKVDACGLMGVSRIGQETLTGKIGVTFFSLKAKNSA
ncbi:hypothetical protein CHUAL_009521 [Chamberlinius hualienensis]